MAFYLLQEMGLSFVIRIKDVESSRTFLHDFDLPDEEEFDVEREMLLSSNQKRALLKKTGDKRPVKFIVNHDSFEQFDHQDKLEFSLRIIRTKVYSSDGKSSVITLATNLPKELFTSKDITDVYGLRWQIETGFRFIKQELSLGKIHSRVPELIKQEVYAAATNFNTGSRIRNLLEKDRARKEKKKQLRRARNRKYRQRIRLSFILVILKEKFFRVSDQEAMKLGLMMQRRTYGYKPCRPDTRKR